MMTKIYWVKQEDRTHKNLQGSCILRSNGNLYLYSSCTYLGQIKDFVTGVQIWDAQPEKINLKSGTLGMPISGILGYILDNTSKGGSTKPINPPSPL